MSIHKEQAIRNSSLNLSGALLSSCQLKLALQSKYLDLCSGSAAAGNKSTTRPPLPRRGAEENGKKQAETGGSG